MEFKEGYFYKVWIYDFNNIISEGIVISDYIKNLKNVTNMSSNKYLTKFGGFIYVNLDRGRDNFGWMPEKSERGTDGYKWYIKHNSVYGGEYMSVVMQRKLKLKKLGGSTL